MLEYRHVGALENAPFPVSCKHCEEIEKGFKRWTVKSKSSDDSGECCLFVRGHLRLCESNDAQFSQNWSIFKRHVKQEGKLINIYIENEDINGQSRQIIQQKHATQGKDQLKRIRRARSHSAVVTIGNHSSSPLSQRPGPDPRLRGT